VRIYIFLFLLVAVAQANLHAQRGWEAGAGLGVGHYFGDLNTDFNLGDPGINVYGAVRYNFSNRWSTRAAVSYMRVSAQDNDSANAYERARNLHFRSPLLDASLGMEFNFLPYDHGSRDNFWTPYVFGSFMVANFEPQAELDGEWIDLRPLGTEGQFLGEEYYTTSLGLSYGIGIKFDITYEWSINVEFNARQLFSDYLDDVSTIYPDPEDLEDARGPEAVRLSDPSLIIPGVNELPLGQEGRLRGNATDNDQAAGLTVGLFYYFGDLRCPEFGGNR